MALRAADVKRTRRLWRGIHRAEVFDAAECRAIAAIADSLPGWKDATVLVEGASAVRRRARRARQLPVVGGRAEAITRERLAPYLERLLVLVRDLDRRHFHTDVERIRDAQLVDYRRGGFYRWHRDSRDASFRKLTALCYLTDRDSHGLKGGETSFAPPSLEPLVRHGPLRGASARVVGWLPTVQRPRRGRVLVFDATMPHRAHRVRHGRKLALNVWFV